MDIAAQLETTGIDLSAATIGDLIHQLKTRCNAVVAVMVVDDDEDGGESSVVFHLGGRITVIGALEDAKARIIRGED